MRAIVIYPDRRVVQKDLSGWDGVKAELGGAYLESVAVGTDFTLYVDEDGLAKGLPRNRLATSVANIMLARLGRGFLTGDYVKGTAVFIGQQLADDGLVECDLPDGVHREYFANYLKKGR